MKLWTDYPIASFGDPPGQRAPIREVKILAYDGAKYCRVLVGVVRVEIKWGYIYTRRGRYDEVPSISRLQVQGLAREAWCEA